MGAVYYPSKTVDKPVMAILNANRAILYGYTFTPITHDEAATCFNRHLNPDHAPFVNRPHEIIQLDTLADFYLRIEAEVIKEIYEEFSGTSLTIVSKAYMGTSCDVSSFINAINSLYGKPNPSIIHYSGHGTVENGVPKIAFRGGLFNWFYEYYDPKYIKLYTKKEALKDNLFSIVYIDACYSAYNYLSYNPEKSFKALFMYRLGAKYFIGAIGEVNSMFMMDLASMFIYSVLYYYDISGETHFEDLFRDIKQSVEEEYINMANCIRNAAKTTLEFSTVLLNAYRNSLLEVLKNYGFEIALTSFKETFPALAVVLYILYAYSYNALKVADAIESVATRSASNIMMFYISPGGSSGLGEGVTIL